MIKSFKIITISALFATSLAIDAAGTTADKTKKTHHKESSKIMVDLRQVIKIDTKNLGTAIIKAGWKDSSSVIEFARFIKIMAWMKWHLQKGGPIVHNGFAVHGPTGVFAYAATKHPLLWKFIPKIRALYGKHQSIDFENLNTYQKVARDQQSKLAIMTGSDRPALDLTKPLLETSGIDDVTVLLFNKPEVIAYFKEYLALNRSQLTQEEIKLLEQLIDPAKDLPTGWNVATV